MDLSSEQPARVGKKYNVLIIDDDAGTRETYEGLDLGGLLSVVRAGLKDSEAGPASITPRSVVERMVAYVVKVLDSHGDGANGDFKTIDEWAKRVGVSYSTLCETCRLLGIRPLDARDFARVLSALRAS